MNRSRAIESRRKRCMSEATSRDLRFYLDDMIGFSEKVIR